MSTSTDIIIYNMKIKVIFENSAVQLERCVNEWLASDAGNVTIINILPVAISPGSGIYFTIVYEPNPAELFVTIEKEI